MQRIFKIGSTVHKQICAMIVFVLLTMTATLAAVSTATTASKAAKIQPEFTSARIDANKQKTRFSAELNFAVGYNAYVLTNPYRVILDIPGAIFNLPPETGTRARGLISGFRFGQLDDKRSRIVINVTGPVLIQNSYAVRKKAGRPARLIVDLVPTDTATFARIHQVDQVANLVAREQAKAAKQKNDDLIPEELPPISANGKSADPIARLLKGGAPLPRKKPNRRSKTQSAPVKRTLKRSGKLTIVIDPGHGGIDTGTSARNGVQEKAVVLAFSRRLKEKLDRIGRYKVLMTRNKDVFLPLRKRVRIAHTNQADLFIAIHADSIKHKQVRGTTLYTLSETASDAEAEALATKENRADIIGGVNLAHESKAISNILIDLAQRETKNHSVYFARKAAGRLKRVTRMTKRPLRSAGFVVLKAPDVPSMLLELGYLSNRHDARLLTSKTWQNKVAGALAQAIDNYFRARVALQ